jgi:large subunit ribosomal protein L4
MVTIPIYDESGKQTGTEQIDEKLLGGQPNLALLKQAVVMYRANKRQGTVQTLSRGMVEGSTRKLYKQKGTGHARAGSARTPQRRGGGRAFAKVPRDYRQDMPKRMRRLARNHAVLAKLQSNDALIFDGVKFDVPKTKRFATMLTAAGVTKGCVFATDGVDQMVYKSGRNIPKTRIMPVAELNAFEVLKHRKLIFTRAAFEAFRNGLGQDGVAKGGLAEAKVEKPAKAAGKKAKA